MKKYLAIAAAVGMVPGFAFAQMGGAATHHGAGVVAGDREVIISGSGRSEADFDANRLSVNGAFAQYLTDEWNVGIRQGVGFSNNGSTAWTGSTNLFTQWHFGDRNAMVRPYIGANFGGFYGDNITNSWTAGPEIGAKWYVQPRTFILTHIDYQWTFQDADDVDDLDLDDGVWNYNIGVGYNF